MSRRMSMTVDILKMMENPSQIRNIGLIGHIDHGKTTLSDSLLAEAGLLADSLAGEARVLDYLEEEQRRGITMKAANISLYYEHSLKDMAPFLINLVDTPGHVDFSGKVTRALRLTDGVVVIVDSVEEISSQTETVVRQALEEAVRPILYINKVDRLFRELKLDMNQIKAKFSRIIQNFNTLIQIYGDTLAKQQWEVSAQAGSVIFGSALHKWGFVIPQLQKHGITLEYFREKYENNAYKELHLQFPVWECVLAAVVQFLPNPIEAQQYRIQKIWTGDPNSEIGKWLQKCDKNGPAIVGLSRVQNLKNRLIATGRVFSGTLTRGQILWLVNEQTKTPINQLSIFMGARLETAESIPAGNIAAIGGIKLVKSGETFFDTKYVSEAKPFESVKYVSEPVITVAVEPDMLKNLSRLQEILEEIQIEDPNVHVETSRDSGECLISGMGPLHLETVVQDIKERGVEVMVSKPTSVFRESILSASSFHHGVSPNELNRIAIALKKIPLPTVQYLRTAKMSVLENEYLRAKEIPEKTSLTEDYARGIWAIDRFQNLIVSRMKEDCRVEVDDNDVIVSTSTSHPHGIKPSSEERELRKLTKDIQKQVINAIQNICLHGIVAQEPLSELMILIKDLEVAPNTDDANFFEISTMIQQAFLSTLKQAQPVLLEPLYTLLISTPEEYIGTVTSLIAQFQGRTLNISQDVYRNTITAKMSVRQSIGFANELRGQTSGRVFWQNIFDSFQPIPENQSEDVINEIKFRKGLTFLR